MVAYFDSQSQLSLSNFWLFSFDICTFSSKIWFRWLSGLWADIFDAVAVEALLKTELRLLIDRYVRSDIFQTRAI